MEPSPPTCDECDRYFKHCMEGKCERIRRKVEIEARLKKPPVIKCDKCLKDCPVNSSGGSVYITVLGQHMCPDCLPPMAADAVKRQARTNH